MKTTALKKQPLLSPSGKPAVPFWSTLSQEELHVLRANKALLTELQTLVLQDPFFYFVRSEPNGISVFANSKGNIALPVTSFKLGTCVHL